MRSIRTTRLRRGRRRRRKHAASSTGSVAGILFVYYNEFISPQALALTASAEVVLMVISGGAGTLFGPIAGAALVVVMKNVASAYIVRWNFLLGAIFVAIVIFMPEGIVPGTARFWRWLRKPTQKAAPGVGEISP